VHNAVYLQQPACYRPFYENPVAEFTTAWCIIKIAEIIFLQEKTVISVLLVDDEKLALDYLTNLINWEKYGFTIVGTAGDGEQAFHLYMHLHPDVIITDVKMPDMSGIDLAMSVRQTESDTRIIFLSGYTEFSFAKQAVRLGVDDYLLKSDLNETVVIKKLLEIKELIQKDRQSHQYTLEKMIQDIFLGVHEEDYYQKWIGRETYLELLRPYLFILFLQRGFMPALRAYLSLPENLDASETVEIRNAVRKVYREDPSPDAAYIKTGMLILPVPQEKTIDGTAFSVQDAAARLSEALAESGTDDYIAAYCTKSMSVSEFGRFVDTRRRRLDTRFLQPDVPVICLDTEVAVSTTEPSVEEDRAVVNEAFSECHASAVEHLFSAVRQALAAGEPDRFVRLVQMILESLSRFSGKAKGARSSSVFMLESEIEGLDLRNPEDVISFLEEKTERLALILHEKTGCTYSQKIENMVCFIQRNYSDPSVSLTEISAAGNVSPAWAAVKFKDEVGTGVNEYLNEYRVGKACELFKSGEYMIYEVADRTGFTSSQYFSKVFRKYTGVTPNQYRLDIRMKKKV
jgi:two-component system, response regulator YesN